MNFLHYWEIVRRWWWLIVLGPLLAGGVGFWQGRQAAPVYQTSTRLLINQVDIPGVSASRDSVATDRLIKTYSELLRSRTGIEETIRQLSLPLGSEELANRITVRTLRDTQILELSVEDSDPVRAAAIANRLADVFIARTGQLQAGGGQETRRLVDEELTSLRQHIDDTTTRLIALRAEQGTGTDTSGEATRLQGDLQQYQQLYFQLLETRQRMELAEAQASSSVVVTDRAPVPTKPDGPGAARSAIAAAALGLLLAVGLVTLIEYFDDRLRDPGELRARFDLPALAILGRHRLGAVPLQPRGGGERDGDYAEALRLLRTNLDFATLGGARTIVVTSAAEGEGKSTVAANLALAEAQAGKRVVLIDANLRRPILHQLFALPNSQGLSTFLVQAEVDTPPLQAGPFGIAILTSGPEPPNPSELLGSRQMADLVRGLRASADVVILDSVPVLPVADTLVLQRYADGVVLVLDVGRTGMKTMARALASLRQASATVFGVVLNKDRHRTRDRGWRLGKTRRSQGSERVTPPRKGGGRGQQTAEKGVVGG